LVAQGYSNAGIVHSLGSSPKTVDTHRTHLMDKLDLHARADLTHYALQHGYLVAPARTGARAPACASGPVWRVVAPC
jgi:regulatory LuxR family protein